MGSKDSDYGSQYYYWTQAIMFQGDVYTGTSHVDALDRLIEKFGESFVLQHETELEFGYVNYRMDFKPTDTFDRKQRYLRDKCRD